MKVYAVILAVFAGLASAQFGAMPDPADQMGGGSINGDTSGESFDIFAAAAAAAGGQAAVGGAGGGMGNQNGFGFYGQNNADGMPMGNQGFDGQGYGGNGYNPFMDNAADQMPYNQNPNFFKNGNAGASAQGGVSASTVAGATIAVIVVVVIFAGIAFFVVRQRRNSRIMIASV